MAVKGLANIFTKLQKDLKILHDRLLDTKPFDQILDKAKASRETVFEKSLRLTNASLEQSMKASFTSRNLEHSIKSLAESFKVYLESSLSLQSRNTTRT